MKNYTLALTFPKHKKTKIIHVNEATEIRANAEQIAYNLSNENKRVQCVVTLLASYNNMDWFEDTRKGMEFTIYVDPWNYPKYGNKTSGELIFTKKECVCDFFNKLFHHKRFCTYTKLDLPKAPLNLYEKTKKRDWRH